MERDTLTLLTVGNIESKSIEDLEKRRRLLESWVKMIRTEIEFVNYVINNKQAKIPVGPAGDVPTVLLDAYCPACERDQMFENVGESDLFDDGLRCTVCDSVFESDVILEDKNAKG